MDISLSMLGQTISISLALSVIATIWFARRDELHTPAFAILVVFAWLVPILGPACLLTILATRKTPPRVEPAKHGTG